MCANLFFVSVAGLASLCFTGSCAAGDEAAPCAGQFFINSNHQEGALVIQTDPHHPYTGQFAGFMSFSGERTRVTGSCNLGQIHFERNLNDGEKQVYTGTYSIIKNLVLDGTFTQDEDSQTYPWVAF